MKSISGFRLNGDVIMMGHDTLEGIDEKAVPCSVTFRDQLSQSSNSVVRRNKLKFIF